MSTVGRRSNLLSEEVEGATVMTNIAAGYYYGMEKIAQRIWRVLARPTRVAELCAALTVEYEVETSTCERDVLEFLNALEAEGLVYQVS
jgi:Coenzyme PQQ synthesis protein D (PqqD)